MKAPLPEKTCRVCGRRMTWRRAWARNWETIETCSESCRRRGRTERATDAALEQAILSLLGDRASGATICPSEAARAIGGEEWRELTEPARAAARRLAARGAVEVTQGGRSVDPSTARGPIRLRRKGS